VPAEEMAINAGPYLKRKEAFVQRVQKMIDYVGTSGCRSQFINHYFGDEAARRCGICDNCLNAAAGALSPEEFEKYAALVLDQLEKKQFTAEGLLKELKGIRKEKAWKVIEFLQAENKIKISREGIVSLK
jgi:ATP-dependent DNA helicase RecQ